MEKFQFFTAIIFLLMISYRTCGVELFDPDFSMCCAGKIHEFAEDDDKDVFCCGDQPYSLNRSICCSSAVLPRLNSFTSCCGSNATYDTTKSLCCDGEVVDFPEKVTADDVEVSTEIAEFHREDIEIPNLLCCGKSAYRWWDEMCCGGTVRPRSAPYMECCGEVEYDTNTATCCGNTVHSEVGLANKLFCCGDKAYDTAVQICCGGEVIGKPNSTRSYTCCGSSPVDLEAEMCCGSGGFSVVVPKASDDSECCGQASYKPDKEICCGEKVYDVNDTVAELSRGAVAADVGCCGAQVYSKLDESCCDGVLNPLPLARPDNGGAPSASKGRSSAVAVCCGKRLLQEPSYDMCCLGNIVPRRTADSACCGTRSFENNRELCCGGSPIGRNSPREMCCGDLPFDPNQDVCCYELGAYHILQKEDQKTMCCAANGSAG